jgi:hypothetical protein
MSTKDVAIVYSFGTHTEQVKPIVRQTSPILLSDVTNAKKQPST